MLKRSNNRLRITKLKVFIFLIFILAIISGIYFDRSLKPIVCRIAQYKVQLVVTKASNRAISEVMDETHIKYTDLVVSQSQSSGEVSFLTYNTTEVNKLKSLITAKIIKKIQEIEKMDIYIPFFNLTNIDFLHNKGFNLHFIITPTAYVETDIESSFTATGINQVDHKIFIVVNITASALIPNFPTEVKFSTKVCVAQTVIIGKVPNNLPNTHRYLS